MRSFAYNVTIFDPAQPGADYQAPVITGPAAPMIGYDNIYSFSSVPSASRYEWRQSRVESAAFQDGAEQGLGNFFVSAATNSYNIIDGDLKATGLFSFHLAHAEFASQILTLKQLFLAGPKSVIEFQSLLGWATPAQIARLQVSLDEGGSWVDIYSQVGIGTPEIAFHSRSASLSRYQGRTVMVRLNYDIDSGVGIAYYPQSSDGVGWYIDHLTMTDLLTVGFPSVSAARADRTFAFSPSDADTYLIEVRPVMFGGYPGEWAASMTVQAEPDITRRIRLTAIQRAEVGIWSITFSLLPGTTATAFEVWSTETISEAFKKEQSATIETIVPNSQYRAHVGASRISSFFQIRSVPP